MADGVNMIALTKDGERFVFLYDDQSPAELLRTFGQYAADPELNFSWYDAAVLSQRVRMAADSHAADSHADAEPETLPMPSDERQIDRDDEQPRRRAA